MDNFFDMIDERADNIINSKKFLKSLPCKVIEVINEGMAKVKAVTTGTEYTLPNFSGSSLYEGENVQVFYENEITFDKSAYIGAAITKQSPINYIVGDSFGGTVGNTEFTVSEINVSCSYKTNCFLMFNSLAYSLGTKQIYFMIYIDGECFDYRPSAVIIEDIEIPFAFSVPFALESGQHKITVTAISGGFTGTAFVANVYCYVFGQGIAYYESYDDTDSSDYIFITNNSDNTANALYYIGKSKNPRIPTALDGAATKILETTAFNYKDVETVYIPDGVEEIR